jgi:hypothetical protein
MADSAVAEFLETVLGRPDAAPWSWQVMLTDGATQEVLLFELGLTPIDAVVLSEEEIVRLVLLAAPEGSVLNTRWLIKRPDGTTQSVLLSQLGVAVAEAVLLSEEELARLVVATAPEGSTVEAPVPPEGAEAQRRARQIIEILGRQPAVPVDLVDTGASPPDDVVRVELRERYQKLREAANLLIIELQHVFSSSTPAQSVPLVRHR